jgi:hypothetical protein
MVLISAAAVAAAGGSWAQEAGVAEADAEAAAAEEALLSEEELDELVGPVALYPDSLLAQVLVAATFPIEIVKADRWLDDNTDLDDAARADSAEEQDWDPSVQVLAGGFPTVVEKMADEIDWTEDLGDAMLAQTDDLMDAVQRQRGRAAATGYLDSNEAQTVEQEGDTIVIEPADPEVVYVPTYDSSAAFTSAPTAAPVVYDTGVSTADILTTGAIAFGGAMLVNEIFDDDDDDWDDYWHGPPAFDWDDDAFYPRPGINVEGDVNIDRDRINVRDRDTHIRDRDVAIRDRDGARVGDRDRDRVDLDDDGRWKADDQRRRDARDKLAAREGQAGQGGREAQRGRESAARAAAQEKVKARTGQGAGQDAVARRRDDGGAARQARAPERKPKDSALKPRPKGSKDVQRASARGAKSAKRPQATQAAARPRASAPSRSKAVSKPKAAKKPVAKRSPPKSSAFKKRSSGGRAKAASSRGRSSHGGGGRRRR